jgi:hypothetical protein
MEWLGFGEHCRNLVNNQRQRVHKKHVRYHNQCLVHGNYIGVSRQSDERGATGLGHEFGPERRGFLLCDQGAVLG